MRDGELAVSRRLVMFNGERDNPAAAKGIVEAKEVLHKIKRN